MARALERCLPMASASDVGEYVEKIAAPTLAQRAERMAKIEQSSTSHPRPSMAMRAPAAESATVAAAAPSATGSSKSDPKRPRRPGAPQASVTPSHADHATGIGVVTDSTEVDGAAAHVFSFLSAHRRLMKRGALAAAALACALLLVALGAALRAQPETRAAAAPAARPVATAPPLATAVPTKIDRAEPAAAERPPIANADDFAAPPAAPAVRVKGPPATSTPKAPARPSAASCDPPFAIDANGFRHYKRECLQ
jgi:hypothetical protein